MAEAFRRDGYYDAVCRSLGVADDRVELGACTADSGARVLLRPYGFASITAHATAMSRRSAGRACRPEQPPQLAVLSLAAASNLDAALTNYGTTTAPIYFGAQYVTQREWWRLGFFVSLVTITVWGTVGVAWWKLLGFLVVLQHGTCSKGKCSQKNLFPGPSFFARFAHFVFSNGRLTLSSSSGTDGRPSTPSRHRAHLWTSTGCRRTSSGGHRIRSCTASGCGRTSRPTSHRRSPHNRCARRDWVELRHAARDRSDVRGLE